MYEEKRLPQIAMIYDIKSRDIIYVDLPFPGNYKSIMVDPITLEGAMEVIIPKETIEPWQVHFHPFKERIDVLEGELFLNYVNFNQEYKLIEEKSKKANDDFSLQSMINNKRFGTGETIEIEQYVPHQLGNLTNRDVKFRAEWSPGPEWDESMEPEYSRFCKCIEGMYTDLLKRAKKNF